MPANLPPDYFAVEAQYRAARTTAQKIAYLEEMLSIVPKHKGTDHLRADLRRRLSELKATSHGRKGASRQDSAFHVEAEGAGQVVVIGPPNVGKSALVAALTNATPEVAAYPYTTRVPTPGMMFVEDVQIQLVDTPPLERGSVEPALLGLIRNADLILLVVDLQADPIGPLDETIVVLQEHRIAPLQLKDRYTEEQRMTFIPLWVVVNKADDETSDEDFEVLCELVGGELTGGKCPLVAVSATTGRNLKRLKQVVFEELDVIRVYAKPPGKEPDFSAPFVLKKGSTIADLAAKVHRDFIQKLSSARVWGSGVYDGQPVGRDHILQDRDIVELRI